MYRIEEVDGEQHADEIHRFNSLAPKVFPSLATHHLTDGHWWFAYHEEYQAPVAFAGMVPNEPHLDEVYFKRCFVMPDHRGRGGGLQLRLMETRILKARQLGYRQIVSECHESNSHSAKNFLLAGFEQTWPEQSWAKDSIYFRKML